MAPRLQLNASALSARLSAVRALTACATSSHRRRPSTRSPPNSWRGRSPSYSNYGRSAIDVSVPGGDFVYPGDEPCTVAGLTRPCWVFDLVFSTGNGGWYWSAGTSMAAPHTSGVAALILSENPSLEGNPSRLAQELYQRAESIGQRGQDPAHGRGATRSGY